MKKLSTLLTLFAVAMLPLVFSSCSDDQEIGMTLEGTWEGDMHVYSSYDGETYQSTRTRLCFEADVFKFKEGSGYWIDYYRDHRWDNRRSYVANRIHWRVSGGVIYIHFREDNYDIEIRNYRLSDNRFEGTIYAEGKDIDFYLVHTSSPNYDTDYDYYGYDYYDDFYYHYGAKASPDSDVQGTEPKKLERHFGK